MIYLLIIILLTLAIVSFLLWRKAKENKKLQAKIFELHKQNKANIEKKTKFLATASHDLQQPHQALGLLLASIHMDKLDLETANIITKAKEAHAATSKLLNQLLDISRLDTTEKPKLKLVALHQLVHSIGMKFMPIAASYGVELRIRQRDAYAKTDPIMLERMLTNILLNAFRHAKKANVLLAIRKQTIDHQPYWKIEVYDNGIGIPKDKQQLIFQEFTKLAKPDPSSTPTGLGLGLAIVKRLSDILEHPVELRSRLGKGSCFSIRLKTEETPQYEQDKPPVDSVIRQRMKVAVINGDTMVRESLKILLTSWGCQVKAFSSSYQTLQFIHDTSWAPHAMIVDGTLESTQLNLEHIQDIRKLSGYDMPMILITKDTNSTFAKEIQAFGFTLLQHPVEAVALRYILGDKFIAKH